MDYLNSRSSWLERANKLKPQLKHWTVSAKSIVKCIASESSWQKTEIKVLDSAATLKSKLYKTGDCFILDFGESLVGHVRIKLRPEGRNDSPLRLRVTAAEMPYEVSADFNKYNGSLSRSWLQDEVVNIDILPCSYDFPRRYSLRYLKVEILAAAGQIAFNEITVIAEAAEEVLPESPARLSEINKKIDQVALRTLRNCMQDVFEDGPKRDRRLWLGDLRLQAKANMQSFCQHELVERSILLMAAATDDDGRVPACIYTEPDLRHGNDLIDYALLFSDVVDDYVSATSNLKLGKELFPLVCRQFELFRPNLGDDGLVDEEITGGFIDWAQLNKQTAMQGVYIYSLKAAARLAVRLGFIDISDSLKTEADKLSFALKEHKYDKRKKIILSGPENEISYAGQVWPILAGVFPEDEACDILNSIESIPNAIVPQTPYMYHHLVEAYFYAGMESRAYDLIERYWGGMIARGADTFWEVFNPADEFLSPYRDALINSACHAWSCTPIYFFRNQ